MAWLRLESVKLQGAPAGRALFTLAGRTPEGPKGIAAAFKGAAPTLLSLWQGPILRIFCTA